jgi:hydrogenase expression/formation protein HypD
VKFVDEFRERSHADALAAQIHRMVDPARRYRLMEFCGGHTHTLCRYGISRLLPDNIDLVHGPGCPVCVLPIGRLDQALRLIQRPGVILCTYGDMMRVPGRDGRSLLGARAEGADVRMVYSPSDALALARSAANREVVFLAVGFETTTPPTAVVVKQAARDGLRNFSVLNNHVLTPPAITAVLDAGVQLDGVIGPGHVCAVMGTSALHPIARAHQLPIVVAGFEPLDLLQAIGILVEQIHTGRAEVEIQYTRSVRPEGNALALAVIDEVMELRPRFALRGLGELPNAALGIRDAYAAWDAERRFDLPEDLLADHPACICGDVLRGAKKPSDCRVFGTACTPDSPLGACMVSSEGACAAWFQYGGAQ